MALLGLDRGKEAEGIPSDSPLKPPEFKEALRRRAPRAAIIYEAIRMEGEDELKRPNSALFWSGLAAGLSMGFSLVTEAVLHSYLPDVRWRPLISKLGYSVGFLIVILGRQQLFTENTLTPILPVLRKPSMNLLVQALRLWIVVLAANLIGTFIFAWTIGHTAILKPRVRADFRVLGLKDMEGDFLSILLRAVFAGWLIALLKWLLPFARTSRLWVIIIITYIIGIAGFSHIIAGSVGVFYAVVVGAATWGDYFVRFMLPTLLGNVIGGVSLVAAINHAQVVYEENKTQDDL